MKVQGTTKIQYRQYLDGSKQSGSLEPEKLYELIASTPLKDRSFFQTIPSSDHLFSLIVSRSAKAVTKDLNRKIIEEIISIFVKRLGIVAEFSDFSRACRNVTVP